MSDPISIFVNSKNQNLYNEVLSVTELKFHEYCKWGCVVDNEKANIYYCDSHNPQACFTHELLHVKYHYLGLKCPKRIPHEIISDETMAFFFNQLSHHKFFDEFCKLGFDKKDFLHEAGENKAIQELEKNISTLEFGFLVDSHIDKSLELLQIYLSLKSPHDQNQITNNFIERIKAIGEENFFLEIDKILEDWTKNQTLNSCTTLSKLFCVIDYQRIGFYLENEKEVIYSKK